jgi:cytochrome c6
LCHITRSTWIFALNLRANTVEKLRNLFISRAKGQRTMWRLRCPLQLDVFQNPYVLEIIRMRRVLCSAFALSLVLSAASVAFAADSGADLYKAKCAGCHGADGTSKMPNVPPLGGADAQGKSDADLKAVIEKGKAPKMPAYAGKLTDAQMDEVVKFIRTLKK